MLQLIKFLAEFRREKNAEFRKESSIIENLCETLWQISVNLREIISRVLNEVINCFMVLI